MTSLRSSVRPKSSKQPWGTVLQPEFGMGYQKMTDYEIDQAVERLYYIPEKKTRIEDRSYYKQLNSSEVSEMVTRLSKPMREEGVTDSKRTIKHSQYKDMGIMSSFAWKGYN